MLASAESIWEQLERNNILKDDATRIQRLKNNLRGLVFNFLNFEDNRIHKDNKRKQIVKNLCEKFVILKPDKGGGVVLLQKSDYVENMESLFMDRTKFKVLDNNPTSTRLATLQNYLLKLKKRGSISEEEYKTIRPKNARPARAFGNPKTHKVYEKIPKFRPVIDTTGTSHYSVGKYLSNLLNPLQHNDHSLRDTFDAADRIRNIPPELLEEGYRFVSFDVESLFTSVPLNRTLAIIEKRVYTEKQINTKLSKHELKKLIKDTCTSTPFSFNGTIYEQIDGVSMGCSLGPLLANIIMTELEKIVVDRLLQDGTLRFYCRYVDDTLMLMKPSDIQLVKDEFEKFDKNLKFTFETFEDILPHFLDIEIHNDGLKIYRKETFTGHYTDFNSFVPWKYRVSWIRSLVSRAKKICDPKYLPDELKKIKTFAAWNNFPGRVRNSLVRRFSASERDTQQRESDTEEEEIDIWLKFPYIGQYGETLLKAFVKKAQRMVRDDMKVNFKIHFQTTPLSSFTCVKDHTPFLNRSNVVYQVSCPGCGAEYIGKTDRTLFERTSEHAWTDKASCVREHIHECEQFNHIFDILTIDAFDEEMNSEVDDVTRKREFFKETIRQHTKILDQDRNWNVLLHKEALQISRAKNLLNDGLSASREPVLFR